MLIGRLQDAIGFVNSLFMQAPKMAEFFEIIDTAPAVHDKPHAKHVERFIGEVCFDNVSFSYDGRRPAILDVSFMAPLENTDGSPLTDVATYRVYYGTTDAPCPGESVIVAAAPKVPLPLTSRSESG